MSVSVDWFVNFDIAVRNFYKARDNGWLSQAIGEGVNATYSEFCHIYHQATGEMFDYECYHRLCRRCGRPLPGRAQWGKLLGRCARCDQAIREKMNAVPDAPQKVEGTILVADPIMGAAPLEAPRVPISWLEDLAFSAKMARDWMADYGD